MDPQDKREIDRLLHGFWGDIWERFDGELSLSTDVVGKLAHVAEKACRDVLEEYFSHGRNV